MLATGWRGGVSPAPRRNACGHAQGNHKTVPYAPEVRLPIRTSAPTRWLAGNLRFAANRFPGAPRVVPGLAQRASASNVGVLGGPAHPDAEAVAGPRYLDVVGQPRDDRQPEFARQGGGQPLAVGP